MDTHLLLAMDVAILTLFSTSCLGVQAAVEVMVDSVEIVGLIIAIL